MQTSKVEAQVKQFGGRIDAIVGQVTGLKDFFGLLDSMAQEIRDLQKANSELEAKVALTKDLEETKLKLLDKLVQTEARVKELEAEMLSIQEDLDLTEALLEECEARAQEKFEEGRQTGFSEARDKLNSILTLPERKSDSESKLAEPGEDAGKDDDANALFQDPPKKKRQTAADYGLPLSSKYFKGKGVVYHKTFFETLSGLAKKEQKKIKLAIQKLLEHGPTSLRTQKTNRTNANTPDGAYICLVGQPFFTYSIKEKIEFHEAGMNK
jgi:chromosome segregation ATPase